MTLRPPDYSDAGNAAVFSREYRNELLYTDALGWFWWNGERWERSRHKASELAMRLSERMLEEARTSQRALQLQKANMQAEALAAGESPDIKAYHRVLRMTSKWPEPILPMPKVSAERDNCKIWWSYPRHISIKGRTVSTLTP